MLTREGWAAAFLLAVAGIAAAFFHLPVLGAAVAFGVLVVFGVFRDPRRRVPSEPLAVVAPVDGRVLAVNEDGEHVSIIIRCDIFGAYTLRSPIEGTLTEPGEAGYHGPGFVLETDEGDRVYLRLEGPLPGRIGHAYGERMGQGQRCGVRRMTRRVTVGLPASAHIVTREGAAVTAGETVLGEFRGGGPDS